MTMRTRRHQGPLPKENNLHPLQSLEHNRALLVDMVYSHSTCSYITKKDTWASVRAAQQHGREVVTTENTKAGHGDGSKTIALSHNRIIALVPDYTDYITHHREPIESKSVAASWTSHSL